MNNRGQLSIIFLVLFLLVLLFILWGSLISPLLTQAGQTAMSAGATGLEVVLWSNLNLIVGLAVLLCGAALLYFAAGR